MILKRNEMKLSGLSNISFSSASQDIHKEQYGEYALDCKGLKNKVTIRIQQREEGNLLLMFFYTIIKEITLLAFRVVCM